MTVRRLRPDDIAAVVALQPDAFPPPFDPAYWWRAEHIQSHHERFPEGQFVAEEDGRVVGACANIVIDEENWRAHRSWTETVGGPNGENHTATGTTLYGLDISVARDMRGRGVGRALYEARFDLAGKMGLTRYGTACRLPGLAKWTQDGHAKTDYIDAVVQGWVTDRTLTPLLRYGLQPVMMLTDYMDDPESLNAACLLEKRI